MRLAGLDRAEPDPDDLRYLGETLLFTESEDEFLAAMRALSRSASPEVAALAADTLSTGYHVALSSGFDIQGSIEASLRSHSAHLRRIVVRNLGQFEAPEVRRWLEGRLADAAIDEADAGAGTVAEEARRSLARLDRAKEEGLSVPPQGPLAVADATTGTPLRAPIGDGPFELSVAIEAVTPAEVSASRLQAPSVDGTFTVVPKGDDMRLGVLRLQASTYAGGFLQTENLLLFVWCRPIGKDRVRCWYRVEVAK